MWRDANEAQKAAEASEDHGATIYIHLGIIDEIIPEPEAEPIKTLMNNRREIQKSIKEHLDSLLKLSPQELVEDRYQKYAKIGEFMRRIIIKKGNRLSVSIFVPYGHLFDPYGGEISNSGGRLIE